MPNHVAGLLDRARQIFATITPAEEKFFSDIANGQIASYLSGQEEIDNPDNASRWGADRTINAECIRWLCTTESIKEFLVAKGVRIQGAKIEGEFRLDHMQIDMVLGFSQCVFTHLVSLEKTKLLSLEFHFSRIGSLYAAGLQSSGNVCFWNGLILEGQLNLDSAQVGGDLRCDKGTFNFKPTGPIQFASDVREVIRASSIKVDGFVSFAGSTIAGGICLYQAHISGNLFCENCQLLNENRCALLTTGATIGGAVLLSPNFIAKGVINLQFVTIKGSLEFETGRITHCPTFRDKIDQEAAINLQHAKVRGLLCFRNGFVVEGKIDLQGATIGGHLDCQRSQFLNPKGLAILGNNARVSNGVLLRKKFRAEGEVRFFSASIGGNLECDSGEFSNFGDTALDAERVRIDGHLFLRNGFRAAGRVRFYAATIKGDMSCDGGNFTNSDGIALDIGSAEVNGNVSLGVGFESQGTVSLLRATIRGDLHCTASKFSCSDPTPPEDLRIGIPIRYALHAESSNVNGSILIRGILMPDKKLTALLCEGTVSFFNAKVGGNVVFFGCGLSKVDGDALVMEGMQIGANLVLGPLMFVDGNLILRRMRLAATCAIFGFVEAEKTTSLDLRFTAAKTIEHRPDGWPSAGSLHLDGLLYDSIGPEVPISQSNLIQWLRLQPKKPISLQPYEQLAKVLRFTGYEREATQVLIAKQDDLLSYGDLSPASKFWKILLKHVLAYGYKPHKALLWVALFFLLGTLLFQAGYDHGLITKAKESSSAGQNQAVYPQFHAFVYSTELFVPFVDLRQRNYWAPADSKGHTIVKCFYGKLTWGYLLTMYFWLQTCVGWALTTIWVAGFTGLVRRLN